MENSPNQERNVAQDRREFIKALDSITIEEIPAIFDENASQALAFSLSETKLLIFGEVHGVKENVDVIYTLFKKFGFQQLALEWELELKAIAEHYLRTGEIDFDSIKDSPDGRITAGHFALLRRLKDEGLLEKLICFDSQGEESWDARDENMAKNLLEGLSDSLTLAIAGNLHAQIKPITLTDEPGIHHPMGSLIKAQLPNTPTGSIEYTTGQFHNYGTKDFIIDTKEEKTEPRFYLAEDGLFTFVLPKASPAIVPNPSENL